jgi:hypothetical protein
MTPREKATAGLKRAKANLKRAKCDLVWCRYKEFVSHTELLMEGYMLGLRAAREGSIRFDIEPKH